MAQAILRNSFSCIFFIPQNIVGQFIRSKIWWIAGHLKPAFYLSWGYHFHLEEVNMIRKIWWAWFSILQEIFNQWVVSDQRLNFLVYINISGRFSDQRLNFLLYFKFKTFRITLESKLSKYSLIRSHWVLTNFILLGLKNILVIKVLIYYQHQIRGAYF